MSLATAKADIRCSVAAALASNPKPKGIPMAIPTFGEDEIMEAIDSLLSQEVTMGKKVAKFEQMFADYMGVKHAVMVNSGSSANLLMMSAASNPMYGGRLMPGDEVIVPALTWSTTIWPVIQTGHMPVLVDCDPKTLCINIDKIEITPRTKAILCAHILGNGCNMDALTELAKKHNLILLEDNCESLGSKYKGKQLGTIGRMGTFSFFFSHHITTIEGGMIVTDDDNTADILRSLRAHGWTREMHNKPEQDPNLDPRFTFCNVGYSVKPTEIQGAFGIHQIQKLDEINKKREKASIKIRSNLAHLPIRFTKPEEGVEHTWFGFPIVYPGNRNHLVAHLNQHGIETRPVIAGNIARHPAAKVFPHRCGDLSEADWITDKAFYISAHLDDDKIEYLTKVMCKYFGK
jgi:CDP-6-deoxy-D-xylo-4-hexulose-3-dehydrase